MHTATVTRSPPGTRRPARFQRVQPTPAKITPYATAMTRRAPAPIRSHASLMNQPIAEMTISAPR